MYRSASRYDSRSIPEKPSRSGRSSWVDSHSRPLGGPLEGDDRGLSRDPYIAGEARILERGFQQHKGGSSSNDLREAQRLAASFFSQYPATSSPGAAAHTYRDQPARSTRPLSPEIQMERYSTRGQYRDRDVGAERWSDRSNTDALYSSRSQLVPEDWETERLTVDRRERMDVYVERGRKREDVGGWDVDYDYSATRKENEYQPMQRGDPETAIRVTRRMDWTGLIRTDPGRVDGTIGLDSSSLSKRASQNYRGGRPYVDSFRNVPEEDPDPEDTIYTRRGGGFYGERYREPDVRKERGFLLDRPQEREYGLRRSPGPRGAGRGVKGRDEWRAERELSVGRGLRLNDSERGRDKGRYEERDSSRRPLYYNSTRHAGGGSGSVGERERELGDNNLVFRRGRGAKYVPKRDFSQRASITNQDILAVYYGNPGDGPPTSNRFPPKRSFGPSGPSRYNVDIGTRPEKWRPHRGSRSPIRGRQRRPVAEFDPSRKGKKRWEKPAGEGTTAVKRFRRETQSDKLYLMHNSKATTEEKDKEAEALPNVSVLEGENGMAKETEETRGDISEPFNEGDDKEQAPTKQNDGYLDPNNGLWDNDDSWTDSEEEGNPERGWVQSPRKQESTWDLPNDEEREQSTIRAPPSMPIIDSKKLLGECSEDDEDAGWESLASDLDDQLDDVCMHQGLGAADAVNENPDNMGIVLTGSEGQASEEKRRVGALSVVQGQDYDMVDANSIERSGDIKGVPKLDSVPKEDPIMEEDSTVKEGRVGGEKKVVVVMEELQENVKIREDKAFDYYVSLFDQDKDLMKLYEANSNCSSFECLVCAGVGAKKRKRFPDIGSLVQHAKKILKTKKLPEHRGFARAVCKMLGWETVSGPSVILPRSYNPAQDSEPKSLPNGAPVIQIGDGTKGAGADWEWASARQLFEEQEARINVTATLSGQVLQKENTTGSLSFCNERKYPIASIEETDLIKIDATFRGDEAKGVEGITASQEAEGAESVRISNTAEGFVVSSTHGDNDVGQPVLMLEANTTVESSVVLKNGGVVVAGSQLEKGTEVERSSLVKETTCVESIAVSKHSAGVEPNSVSESTQLSSRLLIAGEEETPCSSDLMMEKQGGMAIEMWAPLPPEREGTGPFVNDTPGESSEVPVSNIFNASPSLDSGNTLEGSAIGLQREEMEQNGKKVVPSVPGIETAVYHELNVHEKTSSEVEPGPPSSSISLPGKSDTDSMVAPALEAPQIPGKEILPSLLIPEKL